MDSMDFSDVRDWIEMLRETSEIVDEWGGSDKAGEYIAAACALLGALTWEDHEKEFNFCCKLDWGGTDTVRDPNDRPRPRAAAEPPCETTVYMDYQNIPVGEFICDTNVANKTQSGDSALGPLHHYSRQTRYVLSWHDLEDGAYTKYLEFGYEAQEFIHTYTESDGMLVREFTTRRTNERAWITRHEALIKKAEFLMQCRECKQSARVEIGESDFTGQGWQCDYGMIPDYHARSCSSRISSTGAVTVSFRAHKRDN